MKNSISKIILPIILLITCSLSSMAQTQYEYAVVHYNINAKNADITISDKEFVEKKIILKEKEDVFDLRQVLKEVNELTEQGWEVYQTTMDGTGQSFVYFLKREKQ